MYVLVASLYFEIKIYKLRIKILNKRKTKIKEYKTNKCLEDFMVSSDIKMRVAQNCHGYRNIYYMGLMNSISYESESCSSCVNYVKEKCTEGLFDEIREKIMIN